MAFEGSCYNFTTEKLNWIEARDSCTQEGAHLVIINSEAEQKFLTSQGVASWIGLRKQYENDPYTWQDGSAVTYANWDPEISYWERCVYMEPSGYWWSVYCESSWHESWICEKPQVC
ncbi:C-type lectin domain family 4 member G-like [Tamandua tetradactyla]|uniref:C-type lectin domain family 4 member G-like n=1 Tax=Tamandua tetradactyla TaxID=48850 RepID=UPI0040548A92